MRATEFFSAAVVVGKYPLKTPRSIPAFIALCSLGKR
jgi:hypothetical protein